ncbi:hypothetical protein BATDEDRAFT_34485 [Batrachochytrium dendrobatidis JAM81]|uniref:OsmC-like protein n=2 Tax=Batrachochytrium dendrobatidis TaxID=109871 RepID=F4NWN8_BATDJ|nr:uncharacterized protein BATDEDRAFT_34485 [Batrachochytrium dendrobatidis JAM81]EGF82519.1 hypothetical protein BATDEDRAFT_34485 [Batrachochytrium dendrobatidis JAM81]OAJ39479.1 hypothetical protein, variant [Batrachochytrium dendrobatidis JEL423]|eukprot:XP_006676819.1 hypothetical protein BATDEDRAFT_34485 [Batrachochytrium dendrobatidis JAM81]
MATILRSSVLISILGCCSLKRLLKGGAKSNPEQLFAAGYSACFLGALHLVAGKAKITLPASTTVNGHVHIGRHDGSLLLEVELKVYAPDVDKTKLMELVESAHKVCPYSLATRGNVKVHLQSYSHKM